MVIVWIYLGAFNFANPVLYSYPAEVQTFSMRSKGLLLWNTVTQLESAYVTWVDAVALNTIGYKYYAVYMPLVIIQWFLTYFCEWPIYVNSQYEACMLTLRLSDSHGRDQGLYFGRDWPCL